MVRWIPRTVCWTSKSDLRSRTKCDQILKAVAKLELCSTEKLQFVEHLRQTCAAEQSVPKFTKIIVAHLVTLKTAAKHKILHNKHISIGRVTAWPNSQQWFLYIWLYLKDAAKLKHLLNHILYIISCRYLWLKKTDLMALA
jgi:hypothetical protein